MIITWAINGNYMLKEKQFSNSPIRVQKKEERYPFCLNDEDVGRSSTSKL